MADTATTGIEVETPPAEGSSQAGPKDEFVAQLSKIYKRLKFSKKLKSAMKEVEQELLDLLGVRLFTIYQSVDNGKEILASIIFSTHCSRS